MTVTLSLKHLAITAGDPTAEIAMHEGLLGLSVLRRDWIAAAGCNATRLRFGVRSGGRDIGCLQLLCLGAGGRRGRIGSNAPKAANLAVPPGSLDFWQHRLRNAGIDSERTSRFGAERLEFLRHDGIGYSFVEDAVVDMGAEPGAVAAEYAIGGLHSVTVSLKDVRETHGFLVEILDAEHVGQDIAWGRYRLATQDRARCIELLHEPYHAPGTWRYGVGTPHHISVDAGARQVRDEVCERLRDAGYDDVSAEIADGDASSVWARVAGGMLIEFRAPASQEEPFAVAASQVAE